MVKVSVIVPVYNAVNIMDTCLQSLLGQTYQDFEMILIDDGSTDESYAKLQEYANTHVNMKVFTQANQGQAVARNVGIGHALGEFVCFVDIDDYVHIDLLSTLVNEQEKTNADIVWCNAFVQQNDKVVGLLDDQMEYHKNEHVQYILNNASPWRKLIKTSILKNKNMQFPRIRYYEDLAVVPTYALQVKRIHYVDTPLYYYLLHEGSTMHQTKYNEKFECIFDALENVYEVFLKENKDEEYHEAIEWLYIDHLLHAASLRFFAFDKKDCLDQVVSMMNTRYKGYKKNTYYTKKDWKYRLVCSLFMKKRYTILSKLLK